MALKDVAQVGVVEREDAQHATQVEGAEVPGAPSRVEQDAGDEESGEHEEEVDAGPAGAGGPEQRTLDRPALAVDVGEVKSEDEQDGDPPQPVEGGHVGARGGPSLGAGIRHAGRES